MGKGRLRPLSCQEVKRILRELGFQFVRQKGSHEHWKAFVRGKARLVTVDCPKQPFTDYLLKCMVSQSGFTKQEWYEALERCS